MADISKELEAWRSAIYGKDVRQAQIDLSNKLNKEVEKGTETIKSYEAAEAGRVEAEKKREAAEKERELAKDECEKATNAANDIKDELEKKLANGDFIGPQGESGPQGNPGIVTQLGPGMFALEVENGHLMLMHNDNEPQPPMEIDADGHLYYIVG